jgi:hypothetical protein
MVKNIIQIRLFVTNKTTVGLHSRRNLVKLRFGFKLLLALGVVVDSHIELRRANIIIKGHEEPLMEVMVLRKS